MGVNISEAAGTHIDPGTLPGGRLHTSGAGRANGSVVGTVGGRSLDARPRFDAYVPPNGYRWWYIDAVSDDGQNALGVIGFVGSVFSPYYAKARKHKQVDPENHCAINVTLYGKYRRWAMMEHGKQHVQRSASQLRVGPSNMQWNDNALVITVNERCAWLPFKLEGQIRIETNQFLNNPVVLSEKGSHYWQAFAPMAHITVSFEKPDIQWSGHAYLDMNWGDEPLEDGFKNWTWMRTIHASEPIVVYDAELRDGTRKTFAAAFPTDQSSLQIQDLSSDTKIHQLKKGFWRMPRSVHSKTAPRLIATLEDAPFYMRNHVQLKLNDQDCEAIHESLSLDRFIHPITQWMLPHKMFRQA
jgi:carotenoid 1,2-hydratase